MHNGRERRIRSTTTSIEAGIAIGFVEEAIIFPNKGTPEFEDEMMRSGVGIKENPLDFACRP